MRPRIRKVAVVASVFFLVASLGLVVAWRQGALSAWVKQRAVEAFLREVQPHLPFIVESAKFDTELSDVLKGHLDGLRLVLRWGPWRVRLSGPLQLKSFGSERAFAVLYPARATVEPAARKGGPGEVSDPVELEFWLRGSRKLESLLDLLKIKKVSALTEFGFKAASSKWGWRLWNVSAEGLDLQASWAKEQLDLKLTLGAAGWSDAAGEHLVQAASLRAEAKAPLAFEPALQVGEVVLSAGAQKAEILWGTKYFDLGLADFPVRLRAELFGRDEASVLPVKRGEMEIGPGSRAAKLSFAASGEGELRASWRVPALPVAASLARAQQMLGVEAAEDWRLESGVLDFTGEAQARLRTGALADVRGRGRLAIRELGVLLPKAKAGARGIELRAPFTVRQNGARFSLSSQPVLSVARLRAFRWVAALDKTPIDFSVDYVAGAPTVGTFKVVKNLPLRAPETELPIQVGPISASWGRQAKLGGSFALNAIPLAALAEKFCVDPARVPPGDVRAHFGPVQIVSGGDSEIEIQGEARATLFSGFVILRNLAVYDFDTEVPEVHFDLDWGSIRLDQLGAWTNFGEMDGTLEGYAHDVVFQSWFPAEYDFRVQVKPYSRYKVVFSPDAMKNFVRIFAGEDLDNNLPGIADWIAFGWPSRIFGGYDVLYAGMSAFSTEGTVILQTLDPPEIFEQEHRHFILYGPRFKIPLRTSRYPVVLDASGLGNLGRYLAKQIENLQRIQRANSTPPPEITSEKKEDENEKDRQCFDPNF
ncbi:MAG: hypothetical protein AB7P04_03420 [Bacteriovoracia bacterium]